MMNRLMLLIVVATCLVFQSCVDIKKEKKAGPGLIYSDYRIWGDEESGNISVKLQYFPDDPDEPAISLAFPSTVTLDGAPLQHDSTELTGNFYEWLASTDDFGGKHEIVFTDASKKVYQTAFDFPIITLKTAIPAVVHREDLLLELDGFKTGDLVRISLIDTSFMGQGLEKLDTVKDGQVTIHRRELGELADGPISMILNREEDRMVSPSTPGGTHLYISYSLKREFILGDSTKIPLP